MRTDTKVCVGILATVIAGTAYGFHAMMPNNGQERFRQDTLTVNVDAVYLWGANPYAVTEWGVPVEFVHGPADITFAVGATKCIEVPGFGKGCEEGVTTHETNSRRWVTSCSITLREDSKTLPEERDAVVAHEFGHCLGQEHITTEKSVMGTAIPSPDYMPEHWSYTVTPRDWYRVHQLYPG